MSKMIDVDRSRIPIWLLWVRTTNNLVTLGAVALTQRRAREYRKIIERDPQVVRVEVEPSEAHHLYNPDWDSDWQTAYGEEHHKVIARQATEVERKARKSIEWERDQALLALKAAAKRIAELEEMIKRAEVRDV